MVSLQCLVFVVVNLAFSMDSAVSSKSLKDGLHATEALKGKWRTVFDLIDNDNDGMISLAESYYLAKRKIDHFHPPDELIPGILNTYVLFNEAIEAYYGRNTTKTAVTEQEYVALIISYWANHFNMFNQRIHKYYTALFRAIDSDNDGFISFDEFRYYYKILGDSESTDGIARKAFNRIDADGDGIITEDEFLYMYQEYVENPQSTVKNSPMF